jgi:hypothetical protein
MFTPQPSLTSALVRLTVAGLVCGLAACRQPSSTTSTPAGSTSPAAAAPVWSLAPQGQALPAGPGSAQPQITVSARGLIASWLESGADATTLKFSERTAAGWSPAHTVARGTDWFVSWADVPTVLRLRDGTLVAQWLKNVDPAVEAYDIQIATSQNDGQTWSRAFAPHRDGTRTQHGFVSLFEWPGPADVRPDVGLIWLDGRNQALQANEPEGGAMGLRYARFDVAGALRAGAPRAEGAVDDRVCECCPTSLAMSADGLIAAYRDRSPAEVRDIHVTRFENGAWAPPTPVHADNWTVDSCPVNGPAIDARGRRVAVAWFTAVNDEGRASVAFSDDAGRTWGPAVRVDDKASRGHVDVALLDDGSAAVSWIEFADQRSRFLVRRIDGKGGRSNAIELTSAAGNDAARVSGIPHMARVGDELVFVWAESQSGGEDDLNVKGAVARIPRTTAP